MSKKVLVAGLGNMGMSHALAYARIPGFEVVGVCERRMTDIVSQSQSLGKILVQSKHPRDRPRNLRDLNRVGEPVAEMIRRAGREHLHLIF